MMHTRKEKMGDRFRTVIELTRNNGQSFLVTKSYSPKKHHA